jgi:hypothetical protein
MLRALLGWWRGRRARRIRYYGSCPDCGHDWREHPGGGLDIPLEDGCGECLYEVEHEYLPLTAAICHRVASPPSAQTNP